MYCLLWSLVGGRGYRSLNKTDRQKFIELPTQTKSSVWILNLGFVNAQLRDDDCKIRVFKSAA